MEIAYARDPDAPAGAPPAAARVGDLVFVGGQMAVDATLHLPEEVQPVPGYPWHGNSMDRQLRYLYPRLGATLEQLGSSIRHVAKINSYHTQPSELDMALRFRKEVFGTESPPPSTLLVAAGTLVPAATVTLDVTALATSAQREVVRSEARSTTPHTYLFGWPVYSQAIAGGGFVFTAGVTSVHRKGRGPDPDTTLDPESPYSKNVMKRLTRGALQELGHILEAAGCSFADVVKADIYLDEARHLAVLNEVWAETFTVEPPARTITTLPLREGRPDRLIEIELIATDPKGPFRKETVSTTAAPTPLGPEPQAVRAGPYLFLSTQLATDYEQGVPAEARPDPNFPFHSTSVKRQAEYIYRNVEAICAAAGTSARNLVKRRTAHLDLSEAVQADEVWQAHLGDRLPPTTVFGAKAPLTVPGCTVQYDLTAAILE